MLTMVLQQVGLPVKGIALILRVDRILDIGDAVCAYVVDRFENDESK